MGGYGQSRSHQKRRGENGIGAPLEALPRYLLHIVWPSSCPVCGRLAVKICPECLESVSGHFSMFCVECGRDAPCGAHPDGLVCVSVSVYSGINRDVVHSMKYSSRKAIALMMGENMARSLPNPGADFLVPIPLHKGGEREYNQAALIAKGASRVWNVPVKDCVRWSAERGSQASSRGKAQRALPPGAMISDESAAGKNVILVDDVCTTGNTLLAAAGALEAAGANPCGAMVWGRSM